MFQRDNNFGSQIGEYFFLLLKKDKQTHLAEGNNDFVADLSWRGRGGGEWGIEW